MFENTIFLNPDAHEHEEKCPHPDVQYRLGCCGPLPVTFGLVGRIRSRNHFTFIVCVKGEKVLHLDETLLACLGLPPHVIVPPIGGLWGSTAPEAAAPECVVGYVCPRVCNGHGPEAYGHALVVTEETNQEGKGDQDDPKVAQDKAALMAPCSMLCVGGCDVHALLSEKRKASDGLRFCDGHLKLTRNYSAYASGGPAGG